MQPLSPAQPHEDSPEISPRDRKVHPSGTPASSAAQQALEVVQSTNHHPERKKIKMHKPVRFP